MRPPGPRRTGGPTISRRRPLTRSSIDVGRIVPEGIRPHKRIQFGARRLATTHPRGTSTNRRVRKSSARCPVETTSRSSLRNGNSRPTLICRDHSSRAANDPGARRPNKGECRSGGQGHTCGSGQEPAALTVEPPEMSAPVEKPGQPRADVRVLSSKSEPIHVRQAPAAESTNVMPPRSETTSP
jgi:hypothetical protein